MSGALEKLTAKLKPARGALVHRDFGLLCLAILATSFGFYIQRTLELWLIYELTGSALHLGLTGLVRGIPVFVLSPFGGVLADRVDRRRLVILVQTCNGAVNAGLALLAVTGLVEVWHIYVSGFMNASLNALGAPARNVMVPGLVPREMLLNALSLTAMSRKMSQLTAPVLTGLLILWLGSGPAYALNGCVYFSAAFLVAAIHYVSDVSGIRESPFRSLMEGFEFVRREATVWVFLAMELITVYVGSYRALLPIFVAALGAGAGGFGLLLGAAAGGAILGVAVIMSLGNLRYKGLWVAFGLFAYAVPLAVLALSELVSAGDGRGVPAGLLRSRSDGALQRHHPDHHSRQAERTGPELPADAGRGRHEPRGGAVGLRRGLHRRAPDPHGGRRHLRRHHPGPYDLQEGDPQGGPVSGVGSARNPNQ